MTRRRRKSRPNSTRKYIEKLTKLYPSCVHDSVDRSLYKENSITYGEMEYEGIEKLYETVKEFEPTCFMDIGSGRGKLCMYMASKPEIKHSLGIELVKERHEDAKKLKSKLNASKVELFNGDFREVDLSDYKDDTFFIWFSNLCFASEVTNEIFEKLKEVKGIVCCSKAPTTEAKLLKEITIPMSWNKESNVFIYEICEECEK